MKQIKNFLLSEKWNILSLLLLIVAACGSPVLMAAAINIHATNTPPSEGNAGMATQLGGQATTVTGAAEATGGVGSGNLIQPTVDEQIFMVHSDENVLDGVLRQLKKTSTVDSFEVKHFTMDEKPAYVTIATAFTPNTTSPETILDLPIASGEKSLLQEYGTLIVKGSQGYNEAGTATVANAEVMLFVVEKTSTTVKVRAINGEAASQGSSERRIPAMPKGTKLIILSNACAETQKFVAPDMVVPIPNLVYLQKRVMNHVVSDYFDRQNKIIPYEQSYIAEQKIANFRRENGRSLWIGQKGKLLVDRGQMGNQYVYMSEGLRWQFKRQYDHGDTWTFADIIELSKSMFTGVSGSKKAFWFMGKNLLERIQNIDFTKHKDITMTKATAWGFECTQLHTVFGEIYIKHEPTLDYIGYENEGALVDMDGLVRYTMKNEESSSEDVDGEEAKRQCVISIDALALKGNNHTWVGYDDSDEA